MTDLYSTPKDHNADMMVSNKSGEVKEVAFSADWEIGKGFRKDVACSHSLVTMNRILAGVYMSRGRGAGDLLAAVDGTRGIGTAFHVERKTQAGAQKWEVSGYVWETG